MMDFFSNLLQNPEWLQRAAGKLAGQMPAPIMDQGIPFVEQMQQQMPGPGMQGPTALPGQTGLAGILKPQGDPTAGPQLPPMPASHTGAMGVLNAAAMTQANPAAAMTQAPQPGQGTPQQTPPERKGLLPDQQALLQKLSSTENTKVPYITAPMPSSGHGVTAPQMMQAGAQQSGRNPYQRQTLAQLLGMRG